MQEDKQRRRAEEAEEGRIARRSGCAALGWQL